MAELHGPDSTRCGWIPVGWALGPPIPPFHSLGPCKFFARNTAAIVYQRKRWTWIRFGVVGERCPRLGMLLSQLHRLLPALMTFQSLTRSRSATCSTPVSTSVFRIFHNENYGLPLVIGASGCVKRLAAHGTVCCCVDKLQAVVLARFRVRWLSIAKV